jgi:hypothetical protein
VRAPLVDTKPAGPADDAPGPKPITRYAGHIAWGTTVVAAMLILAVFAALVRRDLGDPLRAAAIFAGIAVVVWLAGRASSVFRREPTGAEQAVQV